MAKFMEIFRNAIQNNVKIFFCDDPMRGRKGIEVNGNTYYKTNMSIIKDHEVSTYLNLLSKKVKR